MNSSKSLHVHVGAGVPVSARFLRSTNDQQGVQRNHKVIVGNMVHDLQRLDFCGSSKRKHGASGGKVQKCSRIVPAGAYVLRTVVC